MKTALLLFFAAGFALAQGPVIGTCTILPADNIWNTPVDTLPVATLSTNYINNIGRTSPFHADFGSGTWNGGPIGIPFVKVPGNQAKYPASFLYADESDPGPYAVPLNAPIEGGSNSTGDRHAIAVDTDTCVLYELYRAFPQTGRWQADSGAIFNLRSNALRPATWTSADAAGLPMMPGLVRYDEVASGEIRHAIRFTAPRTQRAFVWPARHYASSITDPNYPPMGQRFRLKAGYDISGFPAEVQVILRALKKYGMILADNGSAWYLSGEPDERWNNDNLSRLRNLTGDAFEAVNVSSLMIDANSGQARQTGVSVTVSPASATVVTAATAQFTAAVQGSTNQAVTWSVNGTPYGNSQVGVIDANGRYTAPSAVPSPATVSVQATSVAGPSATGSAAVTIRYPAPSITSVSPASVPASGFTISVAGSGFRQGAVVKVNGAALATTYVSAAQLTANGSAAAGTSVPVTVANPDGQVSNGWPITVTGAAITVSVSPATATVRVRQSLQLTANVQNTADKRVTWKVNGITGGNSTTGTVNSAGLYTAPSRPATNPVTVSAVSVANPTRSGTCRVTVVKR